MNEHQDSRTEARTLVLPTRPPAAEERDREFRAACADLRTAGMLVRVRARVRLTTEARCAP